MLVSYDLIGFTLSLKANMKNAFDIQCRIDTLFRGEFILIFPVLEPYESYRTHGVGL